MPENLIACFKIRIQLQANTLCIINNASNNIYNDFVVKDISP